MKKLLALSLALAMVFALTACAKEVPPSAEPEPAPVEPAPAEPVAVEDEVEDELVNEAAGNLVGISMPTMDLQRWNQDGDNMKAQLIDAGYEVDLQYAANDTFMQITQIENMIVNGARVIIVAAIDSESLGTVLTQAKEAGCTVIAYDRLIMGSDAVSYYVTFDNRLVGQMQAEYIIKALDLENAGDKTYNIEFITSDPGDCCTCVSFFYLQGAMPVLQPYLDSGVLVCQSGQVDTTEVWSAERAQDRFEKILSTYYADKQLDAVLATNDFTAQGVATALASTYSNAVYPIMTGQDCDIVSVMNMMDGKQAMSIFKDTHDLAAKAVEMADTILKGTEPPINDTETYDNGTGMIPSYLCPPKVCTKDNIQEILIDSGYYTLEQLEH